MSLRRAIVSGGVAGFVGGLLLGAISYDVEHKDDEKGKIVYKANYELGIDLDGDKQFDHLLRLSEHRLESKTFYNYAQIGDEICYKNKRGEAIVDDMPESLKILEVNGKTFSDIATLNEFNKRMKMKYR